jgi:protein TonB
MFESSLMESGGQLKTKTSRWMLVTAIFNLSILAVLILIPLLYPEALPRTALTALLTAPPPPPPPPPPAPPQAKVAAVKIVSEIDSGLHAPTKIPKEIKMLKEEAAPSSGAGGVQGMQGMGSGSGPGVQGGLFTSLNNSAPVVPRVVAKPPAGPVRVSSGTIAGMAISKPDPIYPPIAKAAHVQGAVILHAIISKQGTIENLSIVSGPPMLANAARDAVQRWRYKPYLLNGEPVEVETSITVNFTFGGS